MDTVVPQEELRKVFDQITRDITEKVAGIRLYEGSVPLGCDIYTVYATFEGGFHSSLSLCTEASMFTRLTKHIMQEEEVTPEDVENFTKEFFNVLCGNISAKLFQITRVASRFGVPGFCRGRYEPSDRKSQFVLTYFSDQNEGAQLTHHTFCSEQTDST